MYFGVAAYGVDDPSAHLFRLDKTTGVVRDLGGVNQRLTELKARRKGAFDETQMKIHSKIFQADDGMVYFPLRMNMTSRRWVSQRSVRRTNVSMGPANGKMELDTDGS